MMKSLIGLIKENKKEALKLMRKNKITEIDFTKELNGLMNGGPYVIINNEYCEIEKVQIKKVRVEHKKHFFITFAFGIEQECVEYSLNKAVEHSENNIYEAISRYFDLKEEGIIK